MRLTRVHAQKLYDRGILRSDNREEFEAQLAAEKFELIDAFAHAEDIHRAAVAELAEEI